MRKILPVGIDDFSMIREQDFYYLDKSKFISTLIRNRGMVNLFTRPRRFGKTLTISMLKAFFEVGGNPDWDMKSNREMGAGRSDIMLEDEQGEFGIVIEIKRAGDETNLNAKCDEALRQIEERQYAEELMDVVDTVWVYGIAFARKRCRMKAKKLK